MSAFVNAAFYPEIFSDASLFTNILDVSQDYIFKSIQRFAGTLVLPNRVAATTDTRSWATLFRTTSNGIEDNTKTHTHKTPYVTEECIYHYINKYINVDIVFQNQIDHFILMFQDKHI